MQNAFKSIKILNMLQPGNEMGWLKITKFSSMSSPDVSFKQNLQTTEASVHAHIDAKRIALSKLQSNPQD